jgi:hypothetical protein
MLRRQEEIVVLVQKRPVQGNQSLPLIVRKLGYLSLRRISSELSLLCINLNTLTLYHHEPSVDALDLGD